MAVTNRRRWAGLLICLPLLLACRTLQGGLPTPTPGPNCLGIPLMPEAIDVVQAADHCFFTVQDNPDAVAEYYRKAASDAGWGLTTEAPPGSPIDRMIFFDGSGYSLVRLGDGVNGKMRIEVYPAVPAVADFNGIPIMPEASSGLREGDGKHYYYAVEGQPAQAASFYLKQLPRDGWTLLDQSSTENGLHLSFENETNAVTVRIMGEKEKLLLVIIVYEYK